MQKDQSRGATFVPGLGGRKQYGYGLAWWIDLLNEKKEPVQFSCAGAFGAIPWLNPKLGYGGFLLVEKMLPQSWRLYTELFPILNAMKL